MGLLVPIDHAVPLDHRTACRLARALGNATLHVSTIRPTREHLDHLLTNLVTGSETTINFESDHHLPVALLPSIALADDGENYVDVASFDANLRVWSDRAWVHITPMPLAGLVELAAIIREIFDVEVPPIAGEHRAGTLEVDFMRSVCTATIRTPDRERAVRFFARTCGPRHFARGHIAYPTSSQLARFAELADLMHAVVTISAELAPEVVADLLDAIPYNDWQCDDLAYEPADQRLYTYRVAPIPEADQIAWRAKIAAGLDRIASTSLG